MRTITFIRQFALQGFLLLAICSYASAHDEDRYHGWFGEATYGSGDFPGGGPGGNVVQVPGSPLEVTLTFTPESIHFDPDHNFTLTVVVKNTNEPNPADPDDPVNDPVPVPSRSVGELSFATSVSSNISGTSQLEPGESLTDTFEFISAFDNGCGEDPTAVLNYTEIAGDTIGVRFICDEDYDPLREVPPPSCDEQGSDAPNTKPSSPEPTLNMGGGDAPVGGSSGQCCESAAIMRGSPATSSLAGKFLGSSFLNASVAWNGAGSSGSQMHLLRGIRFLPHRNTFPSSLGLGLFLPYDKTILMFQHGNSYELQVFDPELGFPVTGGLRSFFNEFRWDNPVYADVQVMDAAGNPTTEVAEAAEITLYRHNGGKLMFESPLQNGEFRYIGTMNDDGTQTLEVTYEDEFANKITSVKDEYEGQVDFGFDGTMAGGQEVITSITFPGEPELPVVYDGEAAVEINLPENTKYEFIFEVPTGSVNGTLNVTIKSPFDGDKKYELSSDYRIVSPNFVINQPVGYIRKVYDAEGELEWAIFFSPLQSGLMRVLEDGGRKLTEYVHTESRTSYKSFTVGDLRLGFNAFTDLVPDTVDTVVGFFGDSPFNIPRSATDANGESYTYEYDDEEFITKKTYVDDGTFEEWEYDDLKNVTRYRNRRGFVVISVFDTNGNMTERREGIEDVAGVDTPLPEFAVYRYSYFSDGMIKTEYLPQWNGEADLYRTDYQYNNAGSLQKKIESADFAGGPRPETSYTYNAARLMATMTDPVGRVVTYHYDDLNRMVRKSYNDGSSSEMIYGPTPAGDMMIYSIDRVGSVTAYEYDANGRKTKVTEGFGTSAGAGNITPITEPWQQSVVEMSYLPGTDLVASMVMNGKKTEYVYDHKLRKIETIQYAREGTVLSSKVQYSEDRVFCVEDPYGRKTYQAFSAANPQNPIRVVIGNHPGFTLTDFDEVINLVRDNTSNAPFIIRDAIYDSENNITEEIDGRGIVMKRDFDSRDRIIREISAFGTPVESKKEIDYFIDDTIKETRMPRFFDEGDLRGAGLAKMTFTYTGRQLEASRSQVLNATEVATEFTTWLPDGNIDTKTDPMGAETRSFWHSCCGRFLGERNALGHGLLSNTDHEGRVTHTATVSNYDSHTNSHNPISATTLNETTTAYDILGRVIASTKWLVPRGEIDPNNVQIAGLKGVPTTAGLTELVFHDSNLADGFGLDSTDGIDVELPHGPTYQLTVAQCLEKLGRGLRVGGAGVRFDAGESAGSAMVRINAENEVRVEIMDALGRTVMNAEIEGGDESNPNELLTWTCTQHDRLFNVSTVGGLCLETLQVDPFGHYTRLRTDGAGRLVLAFDEAQEGSLLYYDANDNQIVARDANRVGYSSQYDELNREQWQLDTFGNRTRFNYDIGGNMTGVVDPHGKRTAFAFDAANRRVSIRDRNQALTRMKFDLRNQLLSINDAEGRITAYKYDILGDKIWERYPDHVPGSARGDDDYGFVVFANDAARRLSFRADSKGQSVRYIYDRANRKLREQFRTNANFPSGPIADSNLFEYDRVGRVTKATCQRYGNEVQMEWRNGTLASETLVIGTKQYPVSYKYDELRRHSSITYPNGSVVEKNYTARGKLLETRFDSRLLETRSYDEGNRLTQTAFDNGLSTDFAYRQNGVKRDSQIESMSFQHPAGVPDNRKVGTYTWSYDKNNNKTDETISGPSNPMSAFGFASSVYDSEDRLTAWNRIDGNLNQNWNLSLVGNWNSIDTNGRVEARTFGPSHEILTTGTTAPTHDAQGSLTNDGNGLELFWDLENQLSHTTRTLPDLSTETTTFSYDALGRRVGKDSTVFINSAEQVVAEYAAAADLSAPNEMYVYGSYVDEPIFKTGTGGNLFYSRNSQYSVVALSDDSGSVVERYAYTAYGEIQILDGTGSAVIESSAFANRVTFTGREFDSETGMYFFRSRYMSPKLGQFVSRDAIGYADGMSLYDGHFAPNFNDSTGHCRHRNVESPLREKKFVLSTAGAMVPEISLGIEARAKVKICDNCCKDGTEGKTVKGTAAIRAKIEISLAQYRVFKTIRTRFVVGRIDGWAGIRIYGGIRGQVQGGIAYDSCDDSFDWTGKGYIGGYVGIEGGGNLTIKGRARGWKIFKWRPRFEFGVGATLGGRVMAQWSPTINCNKVTCRMEGPVSYQVRGYFKLRAKIFGRGFSYTEGIETDIPAGVHGISFANPVARFL